jgi:hypothetical protein
MHSMLLERYRRHYVRIGGNTPSDEAQTDRLGTAQQSLHSLPNLRLELLAQFVVIERLIIPILTNVSVLKTLAVFGVT